MTGETEVVEFTGFERCYVLTSSRRYRGVWLTDFEASQFIPGASIAPASWRFTPDAIELSIGRSSNPLLVKTMADSPRRAYRVEFIGTEIAYPGRNRFGVLQRRVLVDQLISARPLTAPTRTEICTPECMPFDDPT
ncbi:MAG: hypothetical protein V4537_05095 [Pseudomonadota bacterium]